MKPNSEPIHMNAKKEDIADVVILPGDPLRAEYIAKNFLKQAKKVTDVRNMLGFTGFYKDKRVTVMGSGMGMASCGIYAFELFYFYNVQKIIRVGTCGVESKSVDIPEVILADKVYTESNYGKIYNNYKENYVIPSMNLVNKIYEVAKLKKLPVHKGAIMTSDIFGPYVFNNKIMNHYPEELNILGEEMESFALIHVANTFNREAAVILTATDSRFKNRTLTSEERLTSLNEMIELALDSII